jgi:ribonuclease R
LPTEVTKADLHKRQDCRGHLVVTIDPDDAKDFDDAICVQPAGNNRWRVWVHIADVSHYVRPGTALDREARARGNSTYLVDRVIPMLPEALSNELCSLKPEVDRLTKCVEVLLDGEGRVLSSSSYPAVIHSRRRFAYEEVSRLLARAKAGEVEQMLAQANQLAQRMRQQRFKAGALDLEMPEVKLRLDESGRVKSIERVVHDASHQLIEEFMLLANETVARDLQRNRRPVIYRIHEAPDPDRLIELQEELAAHGIRCGRLDNVRELQKLLVQFREHPSGDALKITVLRSLKRARYAVDSAGHFGLAKKHYTHFTSPIRRYADLLVHRALFEPGRLSLQQLHQVADHLSLTERNSADAEQDSKTVKLLGYLEAELQKEHRQIYQALVTEVLNFGFFVEVGALCFSGMVRVSSLNDDFYEFEPSRLRLRGRRKGRVIAVGDRVKVSVLSVDRFKKRADFELK